MKKLLVIFSLVVVALAKPAEVPPKKRQYNFGSFIPSSSQDVSQFGGNFQNEVNLQTFNGPEITNVGSSGLNSQEIISSTTAAPFYESSNFFTPSSTISPLLNSEVSTINSVSSTNGLSVGSPIFQQGLLNSIPYSQSLNVFNANPTAIPVLSSTVLPSGSLQSGYSQDILLNGLRGFDLSSYKLNDFGSYETVKIENGKKSETTKSVYFYEAPEEPEKITTRRIIQVPSQKKSYKLLFIKAPSAPEPQPIEISAQDLNQEKTRVYVLVKKPETEQQIRIVASPSATTERPEVFFIKYKTKEEAEKAIKEAQDGVAAGQESINVNGEHLINSIRNSQFTKNGQTVLTQQTFSHNLPQTSFESSTVLPIVSSTFSPNVNYFSTPSISLSGGNYNQFIKTYGSSFTDNLQNNGFSSINNVFSSGNIPFNTDKNLGYFQSSTFAPNTYNFPEVSSFPSFLDLGARFKYDKVANIGQKVFSTSAPIDRISSFGRSLDIEKDNKSTEELSEHKDEPIKLNLGSEASTSNPIFENASEETSTETSDAESSTSL